MIKINLVPADILAKARQRQQTVQAAIVGGVVAVVIAGVSALHFMKARSLERQLEEAKAELNKLEVIVQKVKELEEQANKVRTRLKVIDDLDKGRPLYPVFMSEFTKAVPSGVWVKGMTTNPGGGGLRISLTASSATSEDIEKWLKDMDASGRFSGLELGAVTVIDSPKSFDFTLTGAYAPKP
jgi:Tfp pilus assembly protein PilN